VQTFSLPDAADLEVRTTFCNPTRAFFICT